MLESEFKNSCNFHVITEKQYIKPKIFSTEIRKSMHDLAL